jgi:hypothetical protein
LRSVFYAYDPRGRQLLAYLQKHSGPQYGLHIAQSLDWPTSQFYVVVDRLERAGIVQGEYEENNLPPARITRKQAIAPRRRYYHLVYPAIVRADLLLRAPTLVRR